MRVDSRPPIELTIGYSLYGDKPNAKPRRSGAHNWSSALLVIALSRGGKAPPNLVQFSDRKCKALNVNTFMRIIRTCEGNSVKKTDATTALPCQIRDRQSFNANFGERGPLLG